MNKILIILIIVLVAVGFIIISTNNYDLRDKDGRIEFAKAYGGWLSKIAKNTANAVGYVIKLDWLPK